MIFSDPLLTKRLIMGLLSVILMLCTFEAVRRRRLRERYAILWIVAAAAMLISTLFPCIPEIIAKTLGISFFESASYIFVFFLILVIFHISVTLSHHRGDLEAQARHIALLKTEVDHLRSEINSLKNPSDLS